MSYLTELRRYVGHSPLLMVGATVFILDEKGRLLLLHGTMDDNVHMQNTLQLAYELQKAGKDFELMLYPKSRHRVDAPELNYHLQRLMTDFVIKNL